jgi:probable O-glycosylation ligase (exosortase A-associated)
MVAFVAHSLLSTALSMHPDWLAWQNFTKCVIITIVMVSLSTDPKRHRLILVVISLSLGFEAAKQGWAQLVLHPGARNDNVIPFLGDNNPVAVGMWMLVPVLIALARTAERQWERRAFQFVTVGVIYRALVTYSRGGFLTAGAVAFYYLLHSKQKLRTVVGMIIVVLVTLPVLPESFWSRMQTIDAPTEEQDSSARGRLHFWRVATEMAAAHPITGVGHNAYNAFYDKYDFSNGEYGRNRSVHSAWFGILAELGYVGLFLFALQLLLAVLACRRARRLARAHPDRASIAQFAMAHEVSLLAFALGGSFVPLAYNEMLWHFIGLSIAIERMATAPAAAGRPVLPRASRPSLPTLVQTPVAAAPLHTR